MDEGKPRTEATEGDQLVMLCLLMRAGGLKAENMDEENLARDTEGTEEGSAGDACLPLRASKVLWRNICQRVPEERHRSSPGTKCLGKRPSHERATARRRAAGGRGGLAAPSQGEIHGIALYQILYICDPGKAAKACDFG
jgi:hypothetical protein